jgi:predicted MFS family arabinose efflux permease
MNPWRGLAGLPRSVWIVSAAGLVNRAGTMLLPFLSLYATEHLGLSAAEAALLLGIYGGGALAIAPVAGRLCDRIGALRIMKISLWGSGALLLAFPLAEDFPATAAMVLSWSLLAEAFRPANLAAISHLVPASEIKPAYAAYRLAVNLGMSIGPALGGFLAEVSFEALCFVDGGTSLLAALLLSMSRLRDAPAPRASAHARANRSAWTDKTLLFFLLAVIPVSAVFFQHQGAMPLFLKTELGFPESTYGLLFTLNTGLIILFEVMVNVATAHWSQRRTLSLGAMLCAVGFGGMALAGEVWAVAATVVLWTFGEMMLFPAMSAYITDISPPDRRGEYMGLYVTAFGLSFTLGPGLGVTVYDLCGSTVLWLGTLALGALSAGMFFFGIPRRPPAGRATAQKTLAQ